MMTRRFEIFQRMPIFGGITGEMLEHLLDLSEEVSIRKEEFFFREGDEASCMFVLEEGRVAVLKEWRGKDYLLRHLEVGDCFGEMSLLDLCPRSASVLAVEPCRAVKVTARALYEIYKKNPEQYAMIHMNMGREVSRRLRIADERLFQAKVEADLVDGNYVFHSI